MTPLPFLVPIDAAVLVEKGDEFDEDFVEALISQCLEQLFVVDAIESTLDIYEDGNSVFFLGYCALDKSNSSANVDDCAPILLEATLADVKIFNLPFVFELLDMLEHCIFQDFNS